MEIDRTELYKSGIIYGWEEIIETFSCYFRYFATTNIWIKNKGFLVILNERILFIRSEGLFSQGYTVVVSFPIINILSVSIKGIAPSWVEITASGYSGLSFRCNDNKLLRQKLVANKNRLFEKIKTDGKLDSPIKILQKRLARGEITKDEFHELVQRC